MQAGFVALLMAGLLAGCGGKSSSNSNASLRLINATLTHASISLLANSSPAIPATAIDTVSSYAGVAAGGTTLQVNDDAGAALATTSPSLAGNQHYALLAYESGGTLRTAFIAEETAAPAAGRAALRVFDAATDAGAVDVYVTDPAVDITTGTSSPTFSLPATNSAQSTQFLSFAPATYRVRVTAAGVPTDVRLDIPSIVLASGQLATVIVTPTTGGALANGSVLLQQGAYTAARNTNARVRLAAAVSGGAQVTATAGAPAGNVGNAVVSPFVTGYVVVPAGSAISVSVNGNSVGSPAGTLAAGSDNTLLVHGSPASSTASLVIDDNRLPTLSTNLKIRLLNGLTGAAPPPVRLVANLLIVADNVQPGTASAYPAVAVATATPTTLLAVYSTSGGPNLYPAGSGSSGTGQTLPPNAVYTLFMFGDSGAPAPFLSRDR
jgi:hypothetical protein